MIGIIGAMELEVAALKEKMTDVTEKTLAGRTYTKGKLLGRDAAVAVCGEGKIYAAICAQTMISEYKPDIVINTGVAGAISDKLDIGDVVVSENTVNHDFDCTGLGYERGMHPSLGVVYIPADKNAAQLICECAAELGINCTIGTVATGDQFISSMEQKNFIRESFNAACCEMEGAAIGQTCYVNHVPYCVIRAISDGANGNATVDYPTFAKKAAENSVKIVMKFVEKY